MDRSSFKQYDTEVSKLSGLSLRHSDRLHVPRSSESLVNMEPAAVPPAKNDKKWNQTAGQE